MRLRLLCSLLLLAAAACRQDHPAPPPPPSNPFPLPTCEPMGEPVPSLALPGACDGDWCWVNPLPQGQWLHGVYSPSPGIAWIVGDGGALLRAEGTQVTGMASPTHETLADVWGSSDTDVWVVGTGGTLLHGDGTHFSQVNSPAASSALWTVSGVSATSAWAGGAGGLLMYWDGSTWASVATGVTADVVDIWAAGPADAWVVSGNAALRCSPSGCVPVPGPSTGFSPVRVSGATPDEVYFLSGTRDVFRWNAGTWTPIDIGAVTRVYDLEVSGPGELWVSADSSFRISTFVDYHVFVVHWSNGQVVEKVMNDAGGTVDGEFHYYLGFFPSYAIAARSSDELWAVGKGGRIRWRHGGQEVELLRGSPLRGGYNYDWGTLIADRLLESIVEIPGSEDGSTPAGAGVAGGKERIWVGGPGDIWTATVTHQGPTLNRLYTDTLEVYRSGRSRVFASPSRNFSAQYPVGIHGSSTSNVWVTDVSGLYRFDGSAWAQVVSLSPTDRHHPDYTGPVWAYAEDDVWFGGKDGLHHWNGTEIEHTPIPGFGVSALWSSGRGDLWAVGSQNGQPRADHWDGSAWAQMPLPQDVAGVSSLVHVTGRCPNEVYLIGDRSAVFRWDGEAFHTVPVPMSIYLLSAARIGSELWVTGRVPGAFESFYFDNTPIIIRTRWEGTP